MAVAESGTGLIRMVVEVALPVGLVLVVLGEVHSTLEEAEKGQKLVVLPVREC